MLETLDYTIRIGSTPTFLYFDLYFIKRVWQTDIAAVDSINNNVHIRRTEWLS